jgi:hypothetical protein
MPMHMCMKHHKWVARIKRVRCRHTEMCCTQCALSYFEIDTDCSSSAHSSAIDVLRKDPQAVLAVVDIS